MSDQLPTTASMDELIAYTLSQCERIPHDGFRTYIDEIRELRQRLAHGRLHFAVLGQFNRGKSSFLNALLGTDLLPSSVLPITNVPTVISYGEQQAVHLRFYNDMPDKHVAHDRDAMAALLQEYVTEEHNPRNDKCVERVDVSVPSALLKGGTQFIDTPGFGSTYVHNTQRTVEMLCECDAAFFLLSADLPITQMEIAFLKEVYTYVPRVFFIYNKIDLLAQQQRETVRSFIHTTLVSHFGYLEKKNVFPVCVQDALRATDRHDPLWTQSGMPQVCSTLENFMRNDKFFVLSWALNKKFDDALRHIIEGLRKERDECREAIAQKKQRMERCHEMLQKVREKKETEIDAVHQHERALCTVADNAIRERKERIAARLEQYFNALCGSGITPRTVRMIQAGFPSLYLQMWENLMHTVLDTVEAALQQTLQPHIAAFEQIQVQVRDIVPKTDVSAPAGKRIRERITISRSFDDVPGDCSDLAPVFRIPAGARIFRRAQAWFTHRIRPAMESYCFDTCDKFATRIHEEIARTLADSAHLLEEEYVQVGTVVEKEYARRTQVYDKEYPPLQHRHARFDELATTCVQVHERISS
jgi:GTP-binding protein EngB required for normal cell division